MKKLVLRQIAERDAQAAADFYTDEAGEELGQAFADAMAAAYHAIAERPRAGSPLIGESTRQPGLRSRRLSKFPYLIVYVDRDDHVDVRRILHVRRDLATALKADRVGS